MCVSGLFGQPKVKEQRSVDEGESESAKAARLKDEEAAAEEARRRASAMQGLSRMNSQATGSQGVTSTTFGNSSNKPYIMK